MKQSSSSKRIISQDAYIFKQLCWRYNPDASSDTASRDYRSAEKYFLVLVRIQVVLILVL